MTVLRAYRLLGSRSAEGLSPAVYCELVAKLHETKPVAVGISMLGVALFGAIAAARTADPALASLTLLSCALGVWLIALLLATSPDRIRASPSRARRAEARFALVAVALMTAIGCTSARALLVTDDALIHLMLFSVGMSAMTTTLRNHFRPRVVLLQLAALMLPPAAAMAVRNEWPYWLLVLGSAVLAYTTATIARALYRGVRDNLAKDEQLYRQNLRFEAALDNMAQGLCMFDSEGRVSVCNRRYLEIYGFSAEKVRAGVPIRALLEHSLAVGNHQGESVDSLAEHFLRKFAFREAAMFHNELGNGRTIAVCYEPMDDGGWVTTHEDITDRQAAEARIAYLARHDPLTDLPNRVVFREVLETALVRARRGEQIAVMCLDLDRFKTVNDTLGHPIGDVLLQQAAARLKAAVRESDTVARLGGDEFAVVQIGALQPTSATLLADRIVEALSRPFHVDGHELTIGCSVGVSIAPEDGCDSDQLMRNADLALYRAKSEGRSQHRFFAAEMDERMQTRRRLELDLRRALAAGEFELEYQPLVTVETGRVAGFEALLRWRHPVRGRVMPDEFIPLAEEIGLIVPIGDWVLREACAAASGWPGELRVAVNLSPVQFRAGNLANSVVTALSSSGLAPERLELEITEGVLLSDGKETMAVLHRLRSLGVRVAMDDFGTGYSSLSYLRAFPFDKIKIDRTFVHDIHADPEAMAIVKAVTDLGRSLGMTTTAEGIETEEQLAHLRADGCTEVQGYLLGRPMSAADASAMASGQAASAASAAA